MRRKLPKGTRLAIRQALGKTYSASERERILTRTQTLYNSFIREAPAAGGMNLLRVQYYGGLSVFAFYEAMDGKVENDVLRFGFQSGGAIRDAPDSGAYGSGGFSGLRFLVSDGKRSGAVIKRHRAHEKNCKADPG